jgi:acetoin utilization deacetylase AcuC-like enzyme
MESSIDDLVLFYPEGHQAHYEYGHPERPDRVEAIYRALNAKGWWEKYPKIAPVSLPLEFLENIHTRAYLELLHDACQHAAHLDLDTYTTPASWQLALNAAGGGVAVASAVWRGAARRGFALTRPPGHHATTDQGMGFCLINNIAVAAQHLIQEEGAKRLAIIDLDLHHGNGTQDIFWRRGDVFYISTHQSPLYPGSGSVEEIGAGSGKGTTANFPLSPGSGDFAFSQVMSDLILPLLEKFQPEMLLVSFGFDTHWRDPLGSLSLSAEGYGKLIESLTRFAEEKAQGKIALFLEGGYDLDAGAACGQSVVAALLGQACEDPIGPAPQIESRYWMIMARRAREIWNL